VKRAQLHIASGIREFAATIPDTIAITDGSRSLTYSELDLRANRLANHLLKAGLNSGDRVAILSANRLEYPEIAAGISRAGMVIVPLDSRLGSVEIAKILDHSDTSGLIAEDSLAESVPDVDLELVLSLDGSQLGMTYETAVQGASAINPEIETTESDTFAIAYTSGTTGRPKGVMLSHRSRCLTFYCAALEWNLGFGRRSVAVAPMSHGAGFAFAFAALHTGGTVSMLRSFEPERLLSLIQQDRAQSVFLVPTHAFRLQSLGEPRLHQFDLSSLDTLYFNAAPFPWALKEWTLDTFPNVGLHEIYGSTEASIVTNLRPGDQRRKPGSVGVPWFMTEVRLIDGEEKPVAPGEVGELYSRSPFLMNGYWDDPEATVASTTPDGFFSAGDLAVIDDEGYLFIVDRKHDVIITGGLNIYPREVEEALHGHPDILEAAVVGVPSTEWGEQIAAAVVLAPDALLDETALAVHCRQSIAEFKVPRLYATVNSLPRNPSGKVLKSEIQNLFRTGPGAIEASGCSN
jgi:acyl-CoA synthetase (AMP-forming)/AMP-acid ligase II